MSQTNRTCVHFLLPARIYSDSSRVRSYKRTFLIKTIVTSDSRLLMWISCFSTYSVWEGESCMSLDMWHRHILFLYIKKKQNTVILHNVWSLCVSSHDAASTQEGSTAYSKHFNVDRPHAENYIRHNKLHKHKMKTLKSKLLKFQTTLELIRYIKMRIYYWMLQKCIMRNVCGIQFFYHVESMWIH